MGRPNFFSAAIAIYQNSACLIVIVNMLLILTLAMGKGLQLFFFGQLRALELEHLYERAFYALTESFLVLTVFKDEFKMEFSIFFGILLFLRVFHWIISDRVDLVFQTAHPASWLTHARLSLAIILFSITDLLLIRYCVMHILANGTGTLILFAFEFVLLKNSIMLAAGRYILNMVESIYLSVHLDEDNWEQKSFWTFVVEIAADTTRLLTYVAFFFVILKPYGLPPLHILRDVYITIMSLVTKIHDFIKVRNAQAAMDKEILDATEEDLSRDNVCIICREEMSIGNHASYRYVPKKLVCRHVIHYGCLRSWLERSQRCPTCRRPVFTGEAAAAGVQNEAQPNDGENNNAAQENNVQPQEPPQEHLYFQLAPGDVNELPGPLFRLNFNADVPGEEAPAPAPTRTIGGPGTEDMILRNHIEFPTGLQLPKGWGVLSARDSAGIRQVQLTPGEWTVVIPRPSNSQPSPREETSNID